jgi:hypothetical protein
MDKDNKFSIQQQYSPRGKWVTTNTFLELENAKTKLRDLITFNRKLKVRLINNTTGDVLDDTTNDTHIFFE